MKLKNIAAIISVFVLIACGRNSGKQAPENDTVSTVADTGYTGIKQFMSGQYKISEVNFVNGIREGLTKTFYRSGRLQRTFWYEKGLRQDSSTWFYEEGQVFRITPFVNDTMNGIQKQYYRTGELKAKMGYKKGLRTAFFQEFNKNGSLIKNYPEVVVRSEDTYNKDGRFRIVLELNDKKVNVNWLKGEFTDGLYDTSRVVEIRRTGNTGYIELKKSTKGGQPYVGVIAEILTDFGNRMLVAKKIDLPYKDLE